MMNGCDKLLLNACILDADGLQKTNQVIAIKDGKIIWCGLEDQLDEDLKKKSLATENCHGKLITPGLIDCHTHLVYAGNRAQEFKERLNGATYADIAKRGGGILSTVDATRAASEEQLLEQSLPRLLSMRSEGVLTVEIKSGYGLDKASELKMLRVAKRLAQLTRVRVKTTFLGAHALPPEYKGRAQAYVDYLCEDVLPAVVEEKLADALDVFCESIGFTLEQTQQLFDAARRFGLPVKCHAEQLSNMGATQLSAMYNALSSDHLEYLDEKGINAMKEASMTAVLLPGAYYFLREKQQPPVKTLRQAGIAMAVATDCNPGSSPTTSLPLMMNMACQLFGLTVSEAWKGVTQHAAKALGIENETGAIKKGYHADLIRWNATDASDICYFFGQRVEHDAMINGEWIKKE